MNKYRDKESPEYLILQEKRIYTKIIKCIQQSNCSDGNKEKMLNMMYQFDGLI